MALAQLPIFTFHDTTEVNRKKRERDDSFDDLDGMSKVSFEPMLSEKQAAFVAKAALASQKLKEREVARVAREESTKRAARVKAILAYVVEHNNSFNQLAYKLRNYFYIDNKVGCIVKHVGGAGNYTLTPKKNECKLLVAEIKKQFASAKAGTHPSKWTPEEMYEGLFGYARDQSIPL